MTSVGSAFFSARASARLNFLQRVGLGSAPSSLPADGALMSVSGQQSARGHSSLHQANVLHIV